MRVVGEDGEVVAGDQGVELGEGGAGLGQLGTDEGDVSGGTSDELAEDVGGDEVRAEEEDF